MIAENEHQVIAVKFLSLSIKKIVQRTKTLWTLITSCFGSGIWIDNNNWVDSDYWKDI